MTKKEHIRTTIRKSIKRKRIIKTISWRIISTATTFSIAYAITGDVKSGGLIASVEFAIKTFIYWYHEKLWDRNTRKKIKQIKAFIQQET
jgi:uncharacterized membrane protein